MKKFEYFSKGNIGEIKTEIGRIVILLLLFAGVNLLNNWKEFINIDLITSDQVNNVIFILIPLITLLLTISYTKSNNIKNEYGAYTYKNISKMIIHFNNFRILLVSSLFIVLTLTVILLSNQYLKFIFIIYALYLLVKLLTFLLLTDKNVLEVYLNALSQDIYSSFSRTKLENYNYCIKILYKHCLMRKKYDDINRINSFVLEFYCKLNSDFLGKLEREDKELLVELYEIMFGSISKIEQSKTEEISSNGLTICSDMIIESYKVDQSITFNNMIKASIRYNIWENDFENKNHETYFLLKILSRVTYYILDDSKATEFWQKQVIDELIRLLNYMDDNNEKKNVYIIILLEELISLESTIIQSDEVYAKKIINCFFDCISGLEEKHNSYGYYYVSFKQLVKGIKDKDNPLLKRVLIESLIDKFENNERSDFKSHSLYISMIEHLSNTLPVDFTLEIVQDLLVNVLTERINVIANKEVNYIYIDYLFTVFKECYEDKSFHNAIIRILRYVSMNNTNLAQFVFKKYVMIFIEMIDQEKQSILFREYIQDFLMKIQNSDETMLFQNCYFTLTNEYNEKIEEKNTIHDVNEILDMYFEIGQKCIDLNNNNNYSIVLDSLDDFSKLKSDLVTEREIEHIFSLMYTLAKMSMEKYFVDAIKTSSNSISWYIKDNYISKNKADLIKKFDALIELFKLSLKIEDDNMIVPVFIGTAFMMLGSLLCDTGDKRYYGVIQKILKIKHAQRNNILEMSYELRMDYFKENNKSSFSNEKIKKFYDEYKKYAQI